MYNFTDIEKKWQKHWNENQAFQVDEKSTKKKNYILVEFPYPSGAGLHVGHVRSYTALDAVARYRRMCGENILFPMGWDAFGLPAEQYAIKNHIHPKDAVRENIKVFKAQIQNLGISFDWSREITTTDPEYYKWTQWQFLKFYEHGLAYKIKKDINWCPSCKIGLSNEEASGGVCERCGQSVEQREKDQWMLRMSDYAEDLLKGLASTQFQDKIKTAQINWIGKSIGAEVDFTVKNSQERLTVFTTRPDTLYGVTFMVVAPEHPLIDTLQKQIENMDMVKAYQDKSKQKTTFERTELVKEKTGVPLQGICAVHPLTGKDIPIWISDYVMMGYGTGAIMAVPGHDDRDHAFARKFGIPILPVLAPVFESDPPFEEDKPITERTVVNVVVKHPEEDKYLCIKWNKFNWQTFVMGGIEEGERPEEAAQRELKEETGYDFKWIKTFDTVFVDKFYAAHKGVNRITTNYTVYGTIKSLEPSLVSEEEANIQTPEWVDADELVQYVGFASHKMMAEIALHGEVPFTGNGTHIHSDFINGLDKEEATEKMISYLEEKGIGTRKVNYKLQDWVFSRQRFWGEPIPMIHCEDCGWVPVKEEDLPVLLPDVAKYEPTDNGESPLADIEEFVHTTCPTCGKAARRETDTMPNWAGSSWYWLRYMDPSNQDTFVSKESLQYFGKVDLYNGGMEHATRHLLYARFWNQFLYNIGLVPNKEPFETRVAHGMILGSNGEKMSKSKGNVINPDTIVNEMGADALRTYEMFIGDYEKEAAWSANGLKGCKRFLDRIWNLQNKVNDTEGYTDEVIVHKTIKKVTSDYENRKYNTVVSALMILLNRYDEEETITKDDFHILLHLLNPIAPHITEEINEICRLGDPLYTQSWPTYEEEKTVDDTYEMIVQVNGKVRGKVLASTLTTKEEMEEMAKKIENVHRFIEGRNIIKTIIVPGKLVNIVIK